MTFKESEYLKPFIFEKCNMFDHYSFSLKNSKQCNLSCDDVESEDASLVVTPTFEPTTASEIMQRIVNPDGDIVAKPYSAKFLGSGTNVDWNVDWTLNRQRYVTLQHEHYKAIYDRKLKTPIVSYANVDFSLRKTTSRSESRTFTFDPTLSSDEQFGAEFYIGDKFDRGHLTQRLSVAWGDSVDETLRAQQQADYYTNIVGQYADVNRVVWSAVEDEAQKIAKENGRTIEVTGVWFDNDVESERIYDWNKDRTEKRRVPDAFWKCILTKKGVVECFFVRNTPMKPKETNVRKYVLTLGTLSATIGHQIDANWKFETENTQ